MQNIDCSAAVHISVIQLLVYNCLIGGGCQYNAEVYLVHT